MAQALTIPQMHARILDTLENTGKVQNAAALDDHQDIYAAGLTGFTAVQLMLALEVAFSVRFPPHMLTRDTFASIHAIETCVTQLLPAVEAAA